VLVGSRVFAFPDVQTLDVPPIPVEPQLNLVGGMAERGEPRPAARAQRQVGNAVPASCQPEA
jgi:hypothetical protein